MASDVTRSKVPPLPAELWRMIVHNVGSKYSDLKHLWFTGRQVCTLLRRIIEDYFMFAYLPLASMNWRILFQRSPGPPASKISTMYHDDKCFYDIRLAFDRLIEDRSKAILTTPDSGVITAWELLNINFPDSSLVSLQLISGRSECYHYGNLPLTLVCENGNFLVKWREINGAIIAQ